MSFRRSKEAAEDARRWRQFLNATGDLLARAGLPAAAYDSREWFDYLLMHGCHPEVTAFTVDQRDPHQQSLLVEAIAPYFRAGIDDPGLGIFGQETRAEILRRSGLRAAGWGLRAGGCG